MVKLDNSYMSVISPYTGYIYIIQTKVQSDNAPNVYKIGRTDDIVRRMYEYWQKTNQQVTLLLCIMVVNDVDTETTIIQTLKHLSRDTSECIHMTSIGNESFKIDINTLTNIVMKVCIENNIRQMESYESPEMKILENNHARMEKILNKMKNKTSEYVNKNTTNIIALSNAYKKFKEISTIAQTTNNLNNLNHFLNKYDEEVENHQRIRIRTNRIFPSENAILPVSTSPVVSTVVEPPTSFLRKFFLKCFKAS
jgi:hypothetical protein